MQGDLEIVGELLADLERSRPMRPCSAPAARWLSITKPQSRVGVRTVIQGRKRMSEARKQVFGVIDALPDPHASIIENYVLQIEAENAELKRKLAKAAALRRAIFPPPEQTDDWRNGIANRGYRSPQQNRLFRNIEVG